MYAYQAESDVELNLSVGDYVVIRKVCLYSLEFNVCLYMANVRILVMMSGVVGLIFSSIMNLNEMSLFPSLCFLSLFLFCLCLL